MEFEEIVKKPLEDAEDSIKAIGAHTAWVLHYKNGLSNEAMFDVTRQILNADFAKFNEDFTRIELWDNERFEGSPLISFELSIGEEDVADRKHAYFRIHIENEKPKTGTTLPSFWKELYRLFVKGFFIARTCKMF